MGNLTFLHIDVLDTIRNACKHFVGNGSDGIAEHCNGQVVTKDDGMVAHTAVDVGHINHADVHADVPHVVSPLSVHQAVALAVAQTAIQSVGISNGDGCNARRTLQHGATAVANGVACWNVAYLEDGCLQGRHII